MNEMVIRLLVLVLLLLLLLLLLFLDLEYTTVGDPDLARGRPVWGEAE
jgi:hypothetical protein